MKSIWIFNQTAGHLGSGWGERHYLLSEYWNKKGFKTTIFSGSFNHLFHTQPTSKGFLTSEHKGSSEFCWIKIRKYNPESVFKLWSMIMFSMKLFFLPFFRKDKPDIIIVSSMPLFSVIPGYILSRYFKAEFIFEIRDLWPETPIQLKGFSKRHPVIMLMKWIESVGYKKADQIVSVLPNAQIYINPISKNPEKFNYIPNGIEPNIFLQNNSQNSFLQDLPKNRLIIGYTGTLGLANAMDDFIDTIYQLKDDNRFYFVIVGDGYLVTEYEKILKDNSNVLFIPKVPKNTIQAVILNFDICFLARFNIDLYKYGVSYNKYFDYMYSSKPILEASAQIKDPVELSGCGIIVEPECSQSIINGLNKFYHMTPEQRELMGAKGKVFVENNHVYSILSERYMNIFSN